jgi:CheY-like chemotaxis protein
MIPGGATILLVDDDSTDVFLLRRAFQKAGMGNRIEVVTDGEQAVAYLAGEGVFADRERHPLPSLVLLDIKLPRKSGFEVLTWLRQQPRLGSLPVVMLTSSGQAADIGRAYDAGATVYHVKPSAFDELVELVRTFNVHSAIWREAGGLDRSSGAGRDDDRRMFPPTTEAGLSAKSKIYSVLSRHPAGLTAEALAHELLSRGLAVGEVAVVTKRVAEIFQDLEAARSHPQVVRVDHSHYRAVPLW